MAIEVIKERCPQNHRCPLMRVCPTGAISQNGYGLPIIDDEKCTDCGVCTNYCALGAMKLN